MLGLVKKIGVMAVNVVTALGLSATAQAQQATYLNAPSPEKIAVTSGGIDIRTGRHTYSKTDLSVGDGAGAIKFERMMPTPIQGHVAPLGNFSHNWDIVLVVKGHPIDQYPGQFDYAANVSFGGRSQSFEKLYLDSSSAFTLKSQLEFSKLTHVGNLGGLNTVYTYTANDGTVAVFRPITNGACTSASFSWQCANVDYVIEPDGTRYDFEYETGSSQNNNVRLRAVTSNRGYALLLEYGGGGATWNHVSKACVLNLGGTTKPANNVCPSDALGTTTYTYAAGAAGQLSLASATAADSTTDSFTYTTVTPNVRYQMAYTKAGQTTPWMTNTLEMGYTPEGDTEAYVKSQSFADGSGFTYSYDLTPDTRDLSGQSTSYQTIAGGAYVNALGHATEVRYEFPAMPYVLSPPRVLGAVGGYLYVNVGDVVLQATPGPVRIVDPLGRETKSDYCDANTAANLPQWMHQRCLVSTLQSTTDPEGGTVKIKYGLNKRPTEIRRVAKPGLDLADSVETALYEGDVTCYDTLKVCGKPTKVIDAKGITTEYTWDPGHGGMLTETRSAPTAGAPRPQKRYSYSQFHAWYRNAAGTLVQSPSPVWLITQISECSTGTAPACLGTADETRTTFSYGAAGTANNLLPVSKTVATGNGSLSATTSWTYDSFGNKLTEDGPLPGAGDTTRWRYDIQRRVVGVIAPDPDGSGPLMHPATRNTYDPAGRLVKVETGTVLSQSDADWAAFAPAQATTTGYDQLDRKIAEIAWGSDGLAKGLTQYSYDLAGRLECTAVRMNPEAYGTYPSSACTLGVEGSYGPDRITKLTYDAAGQLLTKTEALGTPLEAVDETRTYTPNGKLATITDGENNRTTYEYDGHDRLKKTRFPVPAVGALASSTTDYEELTYDANDNIETRRKRDGTVFTYEYDALNRMTRKDVPSRPGLASDHTRDVYYGYDLRGLQTYARFDGPAGPGVSAGYDGFGRQTSAASSLSSTFVLGYAYDLAGNRTHVTHPDGVYFQMGYDGLNRMNAAWWHSPAGGYVLHSGYQYDNLGRRANLGRAGSATFYGYDPAGRLSGQLQAFALNSAANNVLENFSYNPAGQLAGRSRDNDDYAWTSHYNVARSYTTNGLNQYVAAGVAAFCYDAKGNLTADGSSVYRYDAENRLVEKREQGAGNSTCTALSYGGALQAALKYDPLGRLYEVSGSAANSTTRFVYDGDHIALEYNTAGTVLRRYVWGPEAALRQAQGDREPILWDEGSAMNCTGTRFLLRDRLGSIVAGADCSGARVFANRYDEYGLPQRTNPVDGQNANVGRFQYTGQAWIPELGLYYYKARMYSPTLGRFMQTDPIGYEDGVNWYAYVGNDPVNKVDPDGKAAFLIPLVIFVAKEAAGEVFEQATGVPAPTVKGAVKAVVKSRIKRAAAREAMRRAKPSIPTSRPGINQQYRAGSPRNQIKENSDGKPAGVVDGSKDRNNSAEHPPGMEAGTLKPGEPFGEKYGQPRIQNETKGKADFREPK